MKVVLDECLPKRLKNHLGNYDVTTVPSAGLAGYSNGKLLAATEKEFDVFITFDGNLSSQQNLSQIDLIIVVVRASSNRLEDLIPLAPQIVEQIQGGKGVLRYVPG